MILGRCPRYSPEPSGGAAVFITARSRVARAGSYSRVSATTLLHRFVTISLVDIGALARFQGCTVVTSTPPLRYIPQLHLECRFAVLPLDAAEAARQSRSAFPTRSPTHPCQIAPDGLAFHIVSYMLCIACQKHRITFCQYAAHFFATGPLGHCRLSYAEEGHWSFQPPDTYSPPSAPASSRRRGPLATYLG